jgi:hypothetical protein
VPLSFRWSPWEPGGRTHATSSCGWCLPLGSHTIKSLSLFQIKNNQIKGLFLCHRFVWSRVIGKVPMLQLEDELLGKGWSNVRCQGTNGPGPMGRLSRPVRVRFRDKIESLLRVRGQVILSI